LKPALPDLTKGILRADSVPALVKTAQALTGLWLASASEHSAEMVGQQMADAADAMTRQLLLLGEREFGPPPVGYTWIAFGSQGRRELMLNSDQDNALVLADDYQAPVHGEYFAQLAEHVCHGLADCGFILCPGDMMASNPAWRLRASQWQTIFTDWITACSPQNARLASNFFDLRCIYGQAALLNPLYEKIATLCPKNDSLLMHWIANSAASPAALGIFRRFIVPHSGEHTGQIDLKRLGIIPVVDLARIHSLAAGQHACGTLDRLAIAAGKRWLSLQGAQELTAAYRFVLALRMRQQRLSLMQGMTADNFVDPTQLTAGEQERLRSSFQLIALQQKALLQNYPYLPGH
jgi:CBS domain-containing protein